MTEDCGLEGQKSGGTAKKAGRGRGVAGGEDCPCGSRLRLPPCAQPLWDSASSSAEKPTRGPAINARAGRDSHWCLQKLFCIKKGGGRRVLSLGNR